MVKKKPKTFANPREAYREGSAHGYQYCMVICMMVMKDKLGLNDFTIKKFFQACESYNEAIASGNMDFGLMRKTLKDEYGIEFRFK